MGKSLSCPYANPSTAKQKSNRLCRVLFMPGTTMRQSGKEYHCSNGGSYVSHLAWNCSHLFPSTSKVLSHLNSAHLSFCGLVCSSLYIDISQVSNKTRICIGQHLAEATGSGGLRTTEPDTVPTFAHDTIVRWQSKCRTLQKSAGLCQRRARCEYILGIPRRGLGASI